MENFEQAVEASTDKEVVNTDALKEALTTTEASEIAEYLEYVNTMYGAGAAESFLRRAVSKAKQKVRLRDRVPQEIQQVLISKAQARREKRGATFLRNMEKTARGQAK